MKFLKRTETATFLVAKPSFPAFLESYDPIIETPAVGNFTGSYRPKTGDVTIRYADDVYTGKLENDRLTMAVHTSRKGETEFYLRHFVLDSKVLFEAFVKQDTKVKGGLSIAQQLMLCIPDYTEWTGTYAVYPGLDKVQEGVLDLDGHMLIRKGDEYDIITRGYFLRMKRDDELGMSRYTVIDGAMLKRNEQTYRECQEVGRSLSRL
jgi:hypothetical protein